MSAALTRTSLFPTYSVDFKATETDDETIDVKDSMLLQNGSDDDRTSKIMAHLPQQCEEKLGLCNTEDGAIELTVENNVDASCSQEGPSDWSLVTLRDASPGTVSCDQKMNEEDQKRISRVSNGVWENKRQCLTAHRGLTNLGNTCYLNSALQMLFTLDSFVDDIIAAYHCDCNSGDKKSTQDGDEKKAFPLRDSLARLFLSLRCCNATSIIDPSDLKKTVDVLTPQFVGFWQQDSHEFLSTVLDLLHDEMMPAKNATSVICTPPIAEAVVPGASVEMPSDNRTQDALIPAKVIDGEMTVHPIGVDDNNKNEQPQDNNFCMIRNTNVVHSDVSDDALLVRCPVTTSPHVELSFPDSKDSPQHPLVFSQLNVQAIADLLHGATSSSHTANSTHGRKTVTSLAPLSSSTCATQDQARKPSPFPSLSSARLVGGRAAAAAITSCPSLPELTMRETYHEDEVGDEEELRSLAKPRYHSVSIKPRIVLLSKMCGAMDSLKEECEDDIADENFTDYVPVAIVEASPSTISCDTTQMTEPTLMPQPQEEQPTTTPFTSTPVDNHFTTQVRIRLTCDSCKYTRTHQEIYRHLSIEVEHPSSSSSLSGTPQCTVHEGLCKFFAPEKREVKCEKCFCESATQTTEITRLPKALLLHFKRFIVDFSPDYSCVTYRKNRSPVEFGKVLSFATGRSSGDGGANAAECFDNNDTLSEFLAKDVSVPLAMDKDQGEEDFEIVHKIDSDGEISIVDDDDGRRKEHMFRLRSVVNHIGNSASCGHYSADAFRRYGSDFDQPIMEFTEKRGWTRFNDCNVTRIEESEAMGESAFRTAYMVLYELE